MLGRTSVGALGAITAALALAALASLPPRATAPAPPATHHPAARATLSALEALRDGRRIDLNRATAADLELLPGIGPSLAQRIVDDRAARGAFTSVAALQRVRGIGPRTIARLQALIRIDEDPQGRAPVSP